MTQSQDASCYEWLANNKLFNVSVEKNQHKSSYRTTKEELENNVTIYGIKISEEDIQKMIDADTIWEVYVYPDNPIGASYYISHDLNIAIDQAMVDYPLYV